MQMSRQAKLATIGAVGFAVVAGGFLLVGLHQAPARSSTAGARHIQAVTVSTVTSTITIDAQAGETFSPPSATAATAAPALTAEQAWAKYDQVDSSAGPTIPSNVSVQLGLLTLPIGPSGPNNSMLYAAHNTPVYGYSAPSCPMSRNPKVTTMPPNPCIKWVFLDANTGQAIDETWQQ
jgi:hypothetical protein